MTSFHAKRPVLLSLLLLCCFALGGGYLWRGGYTHKLHTLWYTHEQEYQAALKEYDLHRCRETATVATNRVILAECQRLSAIIQEPPLSRTLTQLWYRTQVTGQWLLEQTRYALIRLAHDYVYKLIVFCTTLALAYHAYRFYRVAYCRDVSAVDTFRARLTQDYLLGIWPLPRYSTAVDWF